MRRTTLLVASVLISAFANSGLAAGAALDRNINAAPTVTAVHSKAANTAETEKTCRVRVASIYESIMLRQAVADGAEGARVLATLDSVMNIFNNLGVPKCGG